MEGAATPVEQEIGEVVVGRLLPRQLKLFITFVAGDDMRLIIRDESNLLIAELRLQKDLNSARLVVMAVF